MCPLFRVALLAALGLGTLTGCSGSGLTLDLGEPASSASANPVTSQPQGQDTGDTDPAGGQDTGWPTDSGLGQNPGQQPGQNPGQQPGQQPGQTPQDSGTAGGQDSGMGFGQDSGASAGSGSAGGQDSGCDSGSSGQNPGGQSPGGQTPGGGSCTQTLEPGVPGVLDCDGTCAPQTWIGDTVCDDGTYGANFQCAQHQQDGGDC